MNKTLGLFLARLFFPFILYPSSFILSRSGRPGGLCHVDGQSDVADSGVAAGQIHRHIRLQIKAL
jgi:hypothetical protein